MGARVDRRLNGSWLRAKRRQASKLKEIREALVADGFDSAGKQAIALGVSRPTAWALLNRDKRAGPSAMIIKRILSSPSLPPAARRKVEEYVAEKIAGLYGHHKDRIRWFRDQFALRSGTPLSPLDGRTKSRQRANHSADVPSVAMLANEAL
jgi:hypothetical protein